MSERLRLLAITPTEVWPVRDGISLRIHHLLAALSASSEIVLIADANQEQPPDGILAEYRPVELQGRWRSIPSQYTAASLVGATNRAVADRPPDAVLLWPGAEFLAWTAAFPETASVVADRIDCLALTYWRATRRDEKSGSVNDQHWARRYLSRLHNIVEVAEYERRVVRSHDAVVVVGDDDARALRRLGGPTPANRVHVITNGVDLPAHKEGTATKRERIAAPPTPTVVFTGTLNYEPNVRAAAVLARRIWPRVLTEVPNAQLVIAGRNPSDDVLALGALSGVAIQANVRHMGQVFDAAWLAAAPMQSGSGVKNKVLEAWAASLPVVMSPVALNGLTLPPGHEPLVSRDPGRLAATVVTLLQSDAWRQALGQSAFDFVQSSYTWQTAATKLHGLLSAPAGPSGRASQQWLRRR